MNSKWKGWHVVCSLVVLCGGLVSLSTFAAGSTATALIPLLQGLSLDTATIGFGTLAEADFDLGFKEITTAQQVTIKSNSAWVVNISADSATWSFTPSYGDVDPAKAAADLEWKSSSADPKVTSTNASYTGVSLTASAVAEGNRGANITVDIDVRMLTTFSDDPPGSYSIAVTYTITAP